MPSEREIAEIEAVLADPIAVHINMLAGKIARPSIENIVHLYGRDALRAALRAKDREDGARVAGLLRDAQPTVSRHGDEIVLYCPDGTITDDLYDAIEAASCGPALPLTPKESGDA